MEKIVLFINKFESQDLLNLFFDEESPSPAATPSSAVATTAVSDSAAGGAGVGQRAEPATDTMTAEDEAEAAAEMDQPGQEESDGSDTDWVPAYYRVSYGINSTVQCTVLYCGTLYINGWYLLFCLAIGHSLEWVLLFCSNYHSISYEFI